MTDRIANAISKCSRFWDSVKPPVKRTYQLPLTGIGFLYRRLLRKTTFIGITGSLGKTQTKDLIGTVLMAHGRTRYDPGTDNRTYDVAKNLLQTSPSTRFCVQEIGMDGPGSMRAPVRLFRPDVALITNIRTDHSSEFVTRQEHVDEKAEMVRAIGPDGVAVLNADDAEVRQLAEQVSGRVVTFGLSAGADVRAANVCAEAGKPLSLDLHCDGREFRVTTRLNGAHNAYTVTAVIAVGLALEVPIALMIEVLGAAAPVKGRMELVTHEDGTTFLLDDFKSSVGSLPTIVDYLREQPRDGKSVFVVVGTLMYGSDDAATDYLELIQALAGLCDRILLVLPATVQLDKAHLPSHVQLFRSARSANDYLHANLASGDLVVIKGRLSSDHLRRLELSRHSDVRCWQMDCNRTQYCDECPFVGVNLS